MRPRLALVLAAATGLLGAATPAPPSASDLIEYTAYDRGDGPGRPVLVLADGTPAPYPKIELEGFPGVQFSSFTEGDEVLLVGTQDVPNDTGKAMARREGFLYHLASKTRRPLTAELAAGLGSSFAGRVPSFAIQLVAARPREYVVLVTDALDNGPRRRFERTYVWKPGESVRAVANGDDARVRGISVDADRNALLDIALSAKASRVDVWPHLDAKLHDTADLRGSKLYFAPRWWRPGRTFVVQAGAGGVPWFTDILLHDLETKTTSSLLADKGDKGFERVLSSAGSRAGSLFHTFGRWIYFTGVKKGVGLQAEDVFRIDPETRALEQLTFFEKDGLAEKRFPCVSADETTIAFVATEDGRRGLYASRIGPGAAAPRRLARAENAGGSFESPMFRGGSSPSSRPTLAR